ncbi:ATP-binding protein, partial [bacterium]|nr:ATP-binding protein [bacterium]
HFDEIYAEIKFYMFFGQEPSNNRNWYNYLQHNIRVNALYALSQVKKIKITGFDTTSALCSLKIGPKKEVLVPATGSFVITLEDGMEVIIYLCRSSDSVEWATFCEDAEDYSKWDKMFRAAIKEYNQYKNNVFDQYGKFIDLPQATFDDIFLDKKIRDAVQTNIIDYIDEKKVLLKKQNGIPTKRGVIFAGKPGTGKTFISRVLANTLNVTFMIVTNLSSLHELKSIFKFVAQFDRAVLLFEDIDIYIKHRDLGSGLLPTMLNALDGVETIMNHLVVLCTTNDVEVFDDALKNRPGRFDLILPFEVPSEILKRTMLKGFCKEKNIMNVDFKKIITKVPAKYTGAHLKELYISTCVLAIEENSVDGKGIVILTTNMFERALNRIERGSLTRRVIGFDSGDINDNKE